MNRREFSLQLAGVAGMAALSGLGLPGVAFAQPGAPAEGKDYLKMKTPINLPRTGKVEVIEFFWYGCPHCNAFESTIEPWIAKLPADVHFRRVPVQFDALKEIHQQVYYTWEALGLVDTMHKKTFDLASGACLSGDALSIATYPVRVEGDDVWVELPSAEEVAAAVCASDPCVREAMAS